MTLLAVLRGITQNENINFLLTNRVPRAALTRTIGWLSKIEQPWLAWLSIATWRVFTDLNLSESPPVRYASLHQCFTRPLKAGARPLDDDPAMLVGPCDGIVGACGVMTGTQVFQAKGFPYRLEDLVPDAVLAEKFADGVYVTLRLTSAMYHRFHAPHTLQVDHVTYISGDTWNVNPITLKRIERLFCRNERAVIQAHLRDGGQPLLIVPVAAILVASLRLHFADMQLHLRYRGPNEIPCSALLKKGQEMGWFEHGSTIIVFAPPGFSLAHGVVEGCRVRMGERLMHLPNAASAV